MKTKLFWGSSYDRGLDILLKLYPKILKKYPDTTLQICYGWNLFDIGFRDNPERMIWKERINKLMQQKGITHHGRVGKKELQKIRQECEIWVYPTHFPEINCITALDAQKDGLVPCVINFAALKETVQSGVKVEGDIYDDETQETYLYELLSLMGDDARWEKESKTAREFVKNYSWDNIADKWEENFK